jgi:uncharacterized glyoxalase superfamily protein PhnB
MQDHPPQPEFYPMPSFATLAVRELEASARWYQEALGFENVFTIPGPGGAPLLVHLRWAKYADVLLRRSREPTDPTPKGVGVTLSFAVVTGRVDDVAERARRYGAPLLTEPTNQPWNARDFSITDPDGFVLTFTQGPVEPGLSMERIIERSTGSGRA